MAAVHLTDIQRLLIFTTDGTLYWRKSGTWMTPTPAALRFPSLPATIDSVYQVPHSLFDSAQKGADVTFTAIPYAYIYRYDQNDSVQKFDEFPALMNDSTDKGGPNQAEWAVRWALERFDPELFGKSDDSIQLYREYVNNKTYRYNGAFAWESWPTAQSPLWNGKTNAPPVGTCVAGYADHAPDIAYLICPK
jgi:hypothetical protein